MPQAQEVSPSSKPHISPACARLECRRNETLPIAEPGPQFYPVSAIDYLTGYLMAVGAMVALGRRAREGGSWLVRISLAQTGRWLVGRGEVPETGLKDVA